MDRSAFPIEIILEVRDKTDAWKIMHKNVCKNKDTLYEEMEYIKSSFGLKDFDYRIYITLQSKVNKLKT
jgi:hypothetical protein